METHRQIWKKWKRDNWKKKSFGKPSNSRERYKIFPEQSLSLFFNTIGHVSWG